MIIFQYNPKIRTRTTRIVPIQFGELKFDRTLLFSHAIFKDEEVKEVRFIDKEVVSYQFDGSGFISQLKIFSHENTLKSKTQFKLLEKDHDLIRFKDMTPGGEVGNHGELKREDSGGWKLTFHRVQSFLGYKARTVFTPNEFGDFGKEEYYDSNENLIKVLVNRYEYFDNDLDALTRKIINYGWIDTGLSEYLEQYNERAQLY